MEFTTSDPQNLLYFIFADPGRVAILIPLVALTIPIVAIIMLGLKQITWIIIRHRERMAMIQAGYSLDQLPPIEEPSRRWHHQWTGPGPNA